MCYYCHEPGHTKRTCRKLQNKTQQPHLAHVETSIVVPSSSSEHSITISADEFAKFTQYQGALKNSSPPISAIAELGIPNACLLSSSTQWVIDSGATNHMTCNPNLFATFQSYTSPSNVTLAHGSTSPVLGSGTIHPTPLISLSSVLSLPRFSFNMVQKLK